MIEKWFTFLCIWLGATTVHFGKTGAKNCSMSYDLVYSSCAGLKFVLNSFIYSCWFAWFYVGSFIMLFIFSLDSAMKFECQSLGMSLCVFNTQSSNECGCPINFSIMKIWAALWKHLIALCWMKEINFYLVCRSVERYWTNVLETKPCIEYILIYKMDCVKFVCTKQLWHILVMLVLAESPMNSERKWRKNTYIHTDTHSVCNERSEECENQRWKKDRRAHHIAGNGLNVNYRCVFHVKSNLWRSPTQNYRF